MNLRHRAWSLAGAPAFVDRPGQSTVLLAFEILASASLTVRDWPAQGSCNHLDVYALQIMPEVKIVVSREDLESILESAKSSGQLVRSADSHHSVLCPLHAGQVGLHAGQVGTVKCWGTGQVHGQP